MIYLWEVRLAIATLRRAGIEPEAFSCTTETAAEIEALAIKVDVVNSDKAPVMTLRTQPRTLAGVPLRIRAGI